MCSICGNSADFSIVWHDLIVSNSIACLVQTTRCTMMRFLVIDSTVKWLCLNSSIDRLSRLLHYHVEYERDIAKIIAAFYQIFHCVHDLLRLNSIDRHAQTTRCTMMWFPMFDSDINWICLKCTYWSGYLDSLIIILHMK